MDRSIFNKTSVLFIGYFVQTVLNMHISVLWKRGKSCKKISRFYNCSSYLLTIHCL